MALTLYFHPLSSFCQKALIALYENDTPFKPHLVHLMEEKSRAEFLKIWPIGRFPVLHDDADDRLVPESSIIIEYLDQHYPGRTRFIPQEPDAALRTRAEDRFYDLNVNVPMQTIVINRRRPAEQKETMSIDLAHARLRTAYGLIEEKIKRKSWAIGEDFTMADCAAGPALSYANLVSPLGDAFPETTRYLARLRERPSFARVIAEAQPYFHMFPKE